MSDFYKEKAGVDIAVGEEFVDLIKPEVELTKNEHVLNGLGSFAGLYSIGHINTTIGDHVLVSSTDSAGTKTRVVRMFAKENHGSMFVVGADIVNHCVNDIMTTGAAPLFFLDYLASDKLDIKEHSDIIRGMAYAASNNRVPIMGGETAEMPRIYQKSECDVVGFIVGIVEKHRIITGADIERGDLLIGFPSAGLHTNGYSVVNRLIDDGSIVINKFNASCFISPHRSYFNTLNKLFPTGILKGLAHITGGGFKNILRVIPKGLTAQIRVNTWYIPPVFSKIWHLTGMSFDEMFTVFNMGIGMVAIISPHNIGILDQTLHDETYYLLGTVKESLSGSNARKVMFTNETGINR